MTPKIKILVLAANPINTVQLRLGEEVRFIQEELQRAKYRERFELVSQWAVRVGDLSRALLDHKPQIVHFSGHGQGNSTAYSSSAGSARKLEIVSEQSASVDQSLVLEDDQGQAKLVSTDALADLFELFQNDVKCVVLNACYSEMQARAIYQHIDCVVGMNQAIGDQAAIRFATEFYKALATGASFDFAYHFACNGLDLSSIPESLTPVFQNRRGIDDPFHLTTSSLASEAIVPTEAQPKPQTSQSQSFGNISISGSSNAFNAIQSGRNVNFSQTRTQSSGGNPDLQAALNALGQLRQAIHATAELDETEKEMAEVPIKKLETELQKPQPDQSAVDRTITALKKALDGVLTLADPVAKVVALIAKAWLG